MLGEGTISQHGVGAMAMYGVCMVHYTLILRRYHLSLLQTLFLHVEGLAQRL